MTNSASWSGQPGSAGCCSGGGGASTAAPQCKRKDKCIIYCMHAEHIGLAARARDVCNEFTSCSEHSIFEHIQIRQDVHQRRYWEGD